MGTKCIKLALKYIDDKLDKKEMDNILKEIQHKTWLACNKAMTNYFYKDNVDIIQKDIGIKEEDKEFYGESFKNYLTKNIMYKIMDGIDKGNIGQTLQFVEKKYKTDKKEIFKGNKSLANFKRDLPIIIHNKQFSIIDTPKGLGVKISFFNLEKLKELGIKKGDRIKFLFPKIDNSSKSILINLMSKTYKQGTMQINYNTRKKKWMATISYSFEDKKVKKELKENLTMGIDLGITKVATMSIFDSDKEEFLKMGFKDICIDGQELIHYRQKIEARRRQLSIASKWCAENKKGHGYKTRLKAVNKVGDKYNRFKDTYNHKISRYIVDLAEKYECKTIQMENLSGFSEEQTESLLKNWSYYDLQNKITYKANEKGIEVRLINPKYTSKRCSRCGNIHIDNRNCKKDQANFTCQICGHKENADINASKNISIPFIDEIIKETKVQGI